MCKHVYVHFEGCNECVCVCARARAHTSLMSAVTNMCVCVCGQVTDWWEQYVYLRGRSPIMINSNFYGIVRLTFALLHSCFC